MTEIRSHCHPPGSGSTSALPPLRVLLLEDSPHDAELCIQELKKAGFELHEDIVNSREAFVDKLKSQAYDVILCDYRIPDWNGADAFRLLQQSSKDLPFILVTGTLGEEAAVELIKQGVTDYILKDRLARLPTAVRRALEEKAARDERKRTEEALRASDERFRRYFELGLIGMTITSPINGCIEVNDQICTILGYGRNELLQKTWAELTHPDDLAAEEGKFNSILAGDTDSFSMDKRFIRKDGQVVHATISVKCQRKADGSVDYLVGLMQDITESKRAEQALGRSEARLRCLTESSIIGILTGDLNGKIIDANDALLRLLGRTRGDLLSDQMRWDTLTPPNYRDLDQKAVEQLWRTGVARPYEKEFFRKDGSRISVMIGAATFVAAGGETEVIAFVVDISERKKLEEQLRQVQKIEAVGQLTGGIAHDFNNLLGVIIGYSDLLLDRVTLDQQAHKDIEQIKKAGNRAALLTRQLLAFSRKQILQPIVLDLNATLLDTEKLLRRLIGEDIELVVKPGQVLGRVKVDPGQLAQIIMNLAVNARDAMPKGGKLTIETVNVEMDEQFARQHTPAQPGPYVMLAMTDTGCGMNAEIQSRIFEPFFTTKELGKGTGLGLSTVYGVVKQSSGFIWVYSEPGRGTTFKIYLPLADELVEPELPSEKDSGAYPGSETILVVEDDADLRILTHRSLEELSYTILEAGPTEAIRISERYEGAIHLMVTDVVMPGMSGRELADRLIVPRPEMKVLYVSGHTDDTIVHHGMLEPGLAFLQKPFSPRALARKVREVLAARPKADENATEGRISTVIDLK